MEKQFEFVKPDMIERTIFIRISNPTHEMKKAALDKLHEPPILGCQVVTVTPKPGELEIELRHDGGPYLGEALKLLPNITFTNPL